MNKGVVKLLEKIVEKIKQFLRRVFKIYIKTKKSIDNNEYDKSQKGLILSNGVVLNETILLDKDLNATERSYLMIILFKIDINKGYAEISLNDFLRLTGTSNKATVKKVLDRLQEKGIITKYKGNGNESNKFCVLKYMLIIEHNVIKIDTSNNNDTTFNKDINGEKLMEYKDIVLKEINNSLNYRFSEAIEEIKFTCKENINKLEGVIQGYEDLSNKSEAFLENYNK